jgi:hypothetical protein
LVASLAVCVGAWLVVSNLRGATFTGVETISLSSAPCLGANNTVRPGARLRIVTGWIFQADVVSVIDDYQQQGWTSISIMGDSRGSIEMLPAEAANVNAVFFIARTRRAVSLSYTPDLATRVRATTSLTLCTLN